jgi:spermidine synthase
MSSEILTEWLTSDSGYCFRSKETLLDTHSNYQHIQVYSTLQFGKILRLDGCFMTSEADEFFYHENIVHPAAITHSCLKRVLVLGGGDGGVCKEIFKYSSVEQLTLVELDPAVIDVARKYLDKVHGGAMDDPRFELRVEDGATFVIETNMKFDLIILDLTDPVGAAADLYKREFFAACRAILNPGGALTMHIGAPIFHPIRVRENIANLNRVFTVVRPYLVTVPLYGTLWGFACASDTLDPLSLNEAEVERRISRHGLSNLQFYNGATHLGVFALPNFMRRLTAHME